VRRTRSAVAGDCGEGIRLMGRAARWFTALDAWQDPPRGGVVGLRLHVRI
jgi:hypothetical protein